MQSAPRRLRRAERPTIPPGGGLDEATGEFLFRRRHQRVLRGSARAILRASLVFAWPLPAMAVQSVLIVLPGPAKTGFATLYWAVVCRALGMRVRRVGAPAQPAGRPVVFVCNHSSWLDIPVLGSRL
ncbi:MAG: 1-acyl-sn-glycerol-3-phosphate acyltransferase, partial [Rhodospirillales bacterium]|nr:1-acyl-sn-glycerol-3-phosphate acyltransferase [Rhodospirillales bacterium]